MAYYQDRVKRKLDIAGSAVGLVLTAPVCAIVALSIRVTMGSPVIFRQERPGRNGETFTLLKFRTMKNGNAPDSERLTSTGKLLRKSSLDELPQLVNIALGHMSFIGPRPLAVQYLEYYTVEEARRHEVRPGITGLAQVNGRNSLSWEERFALDVNYVDNVSFSMDLKIVLRTIRKVLKQDDVSVRGTGGILDFDAHRRGQTTN